MRLPWVRDTGPMQSHRTCGTSCRGTSGRACRDPLESGDEGTHGEAHDGRGIALELDGPSRGDAFVEVVGPGLAAPLAGGDVGGDAGIPDGADADVSAIDEDL